MSLANVGRLDELGKLSRKSSIKRLRRWRRLFATYVSKVLCDYFFLHKLQSHITKRVVVMGLADQLEQIIELLVIKRRQRRFRIVLASAAL